MNRSHFVRAGRVAALVALGFFGSHGARAQTPDIEQVPVAEPETVVAEGEGVYGGSGNYEGCGTYEGCGSCDPSQPCCQIDCCSMTCDDRNWYLGLSGGWQHREFVHEAGDPQTFIEFNEGFAFNGQLGRRFGVFRLEAECTFMNNDVEVAGAGGASSGSPGNVNLKALMFNAYHDVQIGQLAWKPYVGAGIGIYQSEINSLYPEFFQQFGPPFEGQPVNTTSNMPFAYQFRVGVSRAIGTRSELFAGYRYFRGEELEFASAPFASFGPTFHPDAAKNHSAEIGFRVRF